MSTETMMAETVDPNRRGLYRAGGVAAILLGISYIIITGLYVLGGALPSGAAGRLEHLAGRTTEWWIIVGLSVLTDFLFLLVVWSLYVALKDVNRNAMRVGAALIASFVVLDLAITWPNYAVLITLGGEYAAAAGDAARAALVAAATYTTTVLSSTLLAVYIILVPSLGILIIGLVMRSGPFGKITAYLGVVTGILGIIAVVGPVLVDALGLTAVLTSVLTTVWVFLVGVRLLRLGRL